jgi:deoxyribonuclease V
VAGNLRWPSIPDLSAELRRLLALVPPGRVTSFGDLAAALGDIGAARWVATELARAGDAAGPRHRVLRKTGDLAAGTDAERAEQLAKLRREGIDPEQPSWWRDFQGPRPLEALARWQCEAATTATHHQPMELPDRVGAVDLSYASEAEAVVAYAAVETRSLALVDSEILRVSAPFPYIPGYLTFRELPALLAIVARIRDRIAPVVLVDGSGRLHPRRFGVAVALGVLAGLRTVGVSKHRLCGKPRPDHDPGELWDGGEFLGYRIDGGSKRRTMYVSPGSGLDPASAVAIVRAVWRDRRSPEPIHWADALSRREARC